MDLRPYAQSISNTKAGTYEEWLNALNQVKAEAGRAHIDKGKLERIVKECAEPRDLTTIFAVLRDLHREDHTLEDAWELVYKDIGSSNISLSGWCRAVEAMLQYLKDNNKQALMYDSFRYIACTVESPETLNGKAPLSTAVSHYLAEYGFDAATDKKEPQA